MKKPPNSAELESTPQNKKRLTDEVGDLLFVAVNLARKAGVDPETALIGCNKKFEERFNYIEQQLSNLNNKSLSDTTLDEMEKLWQEAKSAKRYSQDRLPPSFKSKHGDKVLASQQS